MTFSEVKLQRQSHQKQEKEVHAFLIKEVRK